LDWPSSGVLDGEAGSTDAYACPRPDRRRIQVLAHGIAPSVLPSLVGISLYRLDENIRSSLALGFVGAGGSGVQVPQPAN